MRWAGRRRSQWKTKHGALGGGNNSNDASKILVQVDPLLLDVEEEMEEALRPSEPQLGEGSGRSSFEIQARAEGQMRFPQMQMHTSTMRGCGLFWNLDIVVVGEEKKRRL